MVFINRLQETIWPHSDSQADLECAGLCSECEQHQPSASPGSCLGRQPELQLSADNCNSGRVPCDGERTCSLRVGEHAGVTGSMMLLAPAIQTRWHPRMSSSVSTFAQSLLAGGRTATRCWQMMTSSTLSPGWPHQLLRTGACQCSRHAHQHEGCRSVPNHKALCQNGSHFWGRAW